MLIAGCAVKFQPVKSKIFLNKARQNSFHENCQSAINVRKTYINLILHQIANCLLMEMFYTFNILSFHIKTFYTIFVDV